MTKPDDPITPQDPYKDIKGLTKREYFAAMALQGVISSGTVTSEKAAAQMAVYFADSLIKKLNGEL